MAWAGFCDQCGEYVWLNREGGCPRGHATANISGVYEATPPPPQGMPAQMPAPARTSDRTGVFLAVVAAVLLGGLMLCGVMAGISVPVFRAAQNNAYTRVCYAQQRVILGAEESYKASHGALPTRLSDLVGDRILTRLPVCPNGGTYEWDPATGAVRCSVHGSLSAAPGPPPTQ